MTPALLCAAVAVLAWPGRPSAVRRLRSARRLSPSARVVGLASSPALVGMATAGAAAVWTAPSVAALAGGCAALGVRAHRGRRARSRAEAASAALAEALGALAAELRAGRPPGAAVRAAARSCSDASVAAALADALGEPGPTVSAAARVPPDPALRSLGAAVHLSASTGCSLVDVVAALETDVRARQRQALELRTAAAGPRASAVVLAGLPVVGLAMGTGLGAHPWTLLTTTPAGQVLLVAGVGLEVAGTAWVGRLMRRSAPGAGSRRPGRPRRGLLRTGLREVDGG